MENSEFDYVIVGAGSAGAALAARLSEQQDLRILLLEAGEHDRHLWVRVPLGVGRILNDDRFVWDYHTEPEPHLNKRKLYWPHGRMLGGSSSVNGALFVRGEPSRFDSWRDTGCPGWGYQDLLPLFKRIEDCPFGDPDVRGRGGPIPVTRMPPEDPISKGFIGACQDVGLAYNDDYNTYNTEGVSRQQFNHHRGLRASTATGYLYPARRRANLKVCTGAQVDRLIFAGNRVSGVLATLNGTQQSFTANHETILAAGALHSPHLLELSGIGNGDLLRQHGINVVRHLPGVGENLCDHLQARTSFEATQPVTVNDMMRSKRRLLGEVMKFVFLRRGLLRTPSFRAHAFAASDYAGDYPDVRIQCGLVSGPGRYAHEGIDGFPGFHIGSYFIYPKSRGFVHLADRDPRANPHMQANYLDDELDRNVSLWMMRMHRRIAAAASLKSVVVREVRPGIEAASDAELLSFVKETGQTAWHFTGSCKMGRDANAVVDAELRVHGITGLRVADASVMPLPVSSNTNVPSMVIGEKAADLILGR